MCKIQGIRLLCLNILLSLLLHAILMNTLRSLGTCNFGAPVNSPPGFMVSLASMNASAAPVTAEKAKARGTERKEDNTPPVLAPVPPSEKLISSPAPKEITEQTQPEQTALPDIDRSIIMPAGQAAKSAIIPDDNQPNGAAPPPLKGRDFLGVQYEKLTYLISMLGIPVGSAELEAKDENGEILITLRVRSNAAFSGIYPVDDCIETRHIDGKFIMTKIRQQEGSFRSDETFTINLRKRRVSWSSNLKGGALNVTLPTEYALDTLSGIYYLRNRQLEVGRTETIQIFDSETFAEVPVEILGREEMRLPNLKTVGTLLVKPVQKTAGIFRRTGDLFIWLTDDPHKVPVKVVTSIPLGKVTAELISAESKPYEGKAEDRPREQRTDAKPEINNLATMIKKGI